MTSAAKHFDISQLPSIKKGMDAEEEATKRRKTCRFIEESCKKLQLPRVSVSTAMTFFHRFYAKHAFQDHDRFEVAVAAIVLAAKTEESPKKLKTVILECHKLKTQGMQAGRISQQRNPSSSSPVPPPSVETLDPKGMEFAKLKERILLLERVILHTIGFELSIDHPYKFLVEQIKKLIHTRQLKYKEPQPSSMSTSQVMNKMMNELLQYSMNFANDSMHTSLCLQFSPQLIATACVFLACQFTKVEPANPNVDWAKLLGNPGIESLSSICIQIMDLITDKKAGETDSVRKIKAQLELLKSRGDTKYPAASTGILTPASPPGTSEPNAKRSRLE